MTILVLNRSYWVVRVTPVKPSSVSRALLYSVTGNGVHREFAGAELYEIGYHNFRAKCRDGVPRPIWRLLLDGLGDPAEAFEFKTRIRSLKLTQLHRFYCINRSLV